MKVLMVNGGTRQDGCTFTALKAIGETLVKEGIDYEIFHIGSEPIRDCIGCRACAQEKKCVFTENNDAVNVFIEKAKEADGFVFGSPVYFSHPSGRVLSFLDRVFYSNYGGSSDALAFKPGASVVSARRGGTTASFDVLNKYFTIKQMPIVSSTYWNMVHGNTPEEVLRDAEGIQTMRNIGHNMAWLLRCIEAGKKAGLPMPATQKGAVTNFIR
ncbi:MAG: flavodoxin family protein [Firmicutes bacterium]|nr:flavodoxin family protein [Bacillota bacterium]